VIVLPPERDVFVMPWTYSSGMKQEIVYIF